MKYRTYDMGNGLIQAIPSQEEVASDQLTTYEKIINKLMDKVDKLSSSSPSSIERLRIAEEALNNIKEIVWKSTIINKVVTAKDIRNIMKEITTWSNKQESIQCAGMSDNVKGDKYVG